MSTTRPFRFGVHSSLAADGKAWVDNARRVEDLGFSTLLLRDHFDEQLGPIAAMASAAAVTTTLNVGCLVFANDYRHPLVLAKEMAAIDIISGGRLEVGLGAGWMAPDYEQAGMPFDPPGERVTRFEEALAVMKGCFGDGSFSVAGEHYTISGHDAVPKPVTRPHPPFLIGGGGPRMLGIAAREAQIIGINPAKLSNAEWEDQNIGDATAEAMDRKVGWIREASGDRYDDIELSVVVPFVIVTDDRAGTAEALIGGLDTSTADVEATPDTVLSSPYVLIGSVAEICDTLRERRERHDLSYVVFNDDSIDAAAPIIAELAGT